MRMILVAVAAMLFSCTTDSGTTQKGTLVQDCGDVPLQPGRAVAFDGNGSATMSGQDWAALSAWSDKADAWMQCAADHN